LPQIFNRKSISPSTRSQPKFLKAQSFNSSEQQYFVSGTASQAQNDKIC